MIKLLVFLVFVGGNGVTVASTQLGEYETDSMCRQAIEEYLPTIWRSNHLITVYPLCHEGNFWNEK